MTTIPRFLSAGFMVILVRSFLSFARDFISGLVRLFFEGLHIKFSGSSISNLLLVVSMKYSRVLLPECLADGDIYGGFVTNFILLCMYILVFVSHAILVPFSDAGFFCC